MKQVLDLMRDVLENGYDHPDRTGTGRRSFIGRMLRFNMKDGFPIVTSRKISYKSAIAETIGFIQADMFIQSYKNNNCNFWNRWAVKREDVEAYVDSQLKETFNNDKERLSVIDKLVEQFEGCFGPIYGPNWRFIPRNMTEESLIMGKEFKEEMIASDVQRLLKEDVELEGLVDYEENKYHILKERYDTVIDPFHELVLSLKNNPYSSRHYVTAWNPEYIPDESFSPQLNVLSGRGALAPCHTMFQCFCEPPKKEGGKIRLILLFYMR